MGLANLPLEWDYQMCPGNGTSQCVLQMGVAKVLRELDQPMCPGNGTIQCALGMGLYNVFWKGTSQCAL